MSSLDPQTVLLFVVAVWLMVYAGVGKKQLRMRHHQECPHCGTRHAPGNCLRSG